MSQLGIAIPVFWLGILLVTVFAIDLRLFPSGGFPLKGWSDFGQATVSLVLPVLTVALVIAASLLRYVRSATQDVLGSDYLRTARALGASFPEALIRHGIRNGAVPVISILGIELATGFLGAVVVEKVYSLPGLGSMLLLAISQRDYPDVPGRAVRLDAVGAADRLCRRSRAAPDRSAPLRAGADLVTSPAPPRRQDAAARRPSGSA